MLVAALCVIVNCYCCLNYTRKPRTGRAEVEPCCLVDGDCKDVSRLVFPMYMRQQFGLHDLPNRNRSEISASLQLSHQKMQPKALFSFGSKKGRPHVDFAQPQMKLGASPEQLSLLDALPGT